MTPDVLVRLGYAIGVVLGGPGREAVIAKDTRLSGYMVESAIEAGLVAAGMDTALTGPLPTSACSKLVSEENAAAGIVISASHNPFNDNGIKIFDSKGNKLSDEQEREIERLASIEAKPNWSKEPGKARRIDDATKRYVDFCLSTVPNLSLKNINLVVDAANGSAYACAPDVFKKLGANVYEYACKPDGRNINLNCGALFPEVAAEIVVEKKCDVGIVLDGDADRLVMIDKKGRIIDGDSYLYVFCVCLKTLGDAPKGIVSTLVSNQALALAVEKMGISFARSDVGDRHVVAMLRDKNWQIGGEPSGHLLMLHKHGTGDGIIAALALLEVLEKANLDLASVVDEYTPMPTAKLNIPCNDPKELCEKLTVTVESMQKEDGVARVILRPSGTEPLLRLVVEALTEKKALEVVKVISDILATKQ